MNELISKNGTTKKQCYQVIQEFLKSENFSQQLIEQFKQEQSNQSLSIKGPQVEITSPDDHTSNSYTNNQQPQSSLPQLIQTAQLSQYQKQITDQIKDKYLYQIDCKYTIPKINLRNCRFGQQFKREKELFPMELFTKHFRKLKTVFGHKILEEQLTEDFDESEAFYPSSIFNLIYDKTGKYILTGDDDGQICSFYNFFSKGQLNSDVLQQEVFYTLSNPIVAIQMHQTFPQTIVIFAVLKMQELLEFGTLNPEPHAPYFKTSKKKKCSLEIYTNEDKLILATCSEEANIYIYTEDQWACSKEMQKLQHPLRITSPYLNTQQIQTLEFHPDGFLTIGTDSGDIIIFDSIKLLFNRNQIKLQEKDNKHLLNSILWKQHAKNCHLSLWNKKGTLFITGSMDGTAKIWNWHSSNVFENENKTSLFTMTYDNFKYQQDTECWAVNWSCSSRYAIATFTKKSKKKSEDGKLSSNIQIYDSLLNKVIQKIDSNSGIIHSFFNMYIVSLTMNQYIYIIEVHPYKDNIAFTADYNGDVIIWDIITGRILNIFNELGTHLLYPNLELPIIDGRFSPSGYSFALSTYYGSFSIYGYGCPDPYLYTPVQQFFENDFKKFEVDENLNVIDSETKVETYKQKLGSLCNQLQFSKLQLGRYNHQPYEYQFLSQEHKFSDTNLCQDYSYFLKLAKENRKQNKYFEEQLNSQIQLNLETMQKQHIIFCQMRDFEKCMFLGINFNEIFLTLGQYFGNKEEFNGKLLKFSRVLSSFSSEHNQLVLKKHLIPPMIESSTTKLTSLFNKKHLSIPTILSFFNKITEENKNEDSMIFKINSLTQSKRRGRMSKRQTQEQQKVQTKAQEEIMIDYDDPEDLNYEVSDKSQGDNLEEEENEKVQSPLIEKPNLRHLKHNSHKSNRKILTRSQAAGSKQLKYSEMMYSNDSFDEDDNRPSQSYRRRFRIIGGSGSEASWSDESIGKNKRYEMRKRKKIHFNEDGELEREEEFDDDEFVQSRSKRVVRNQVRRQRLNSSESEHQMEEHQMEVEENQSQKKINEEDSLFNIEEEEQNKKKSEHISETSQQKGHKLHRLAKVGAGRRNYQQTNTPNHHSRILLRNTLPESMRQQTIQRTKNQQLDQCSRCNYDNASIKCSISWCGKLFHEHCAGLRGVLQPNTGKFYCHACFFLQNSQTIINQLQSQAIRNKKKNNEKISQQFSNYQEMLIYEPQVGDIVYYLFEAHELFVSRYFWYLDFNLLSRSLLDDDENATEILPFLLYQKLQKSGKSLEPLKVISVSYEFSPYCKTVVLTNVGLQLVSDPTFKFNIQYAHFDFDSSFLILASIYNYYVNSVLPNIEQFDNVEALVWSQEELAWSYVHRNIQIMKIESQDQAFSDSKWQNLMVRSIDSEGYALRNQNQQQFRINCWQLTSFSKTKGKIIKSPQVMEWGSGSVESNSILELIEKFIEDNEELCKEFAEPIDLNYYSNYFDVVPSEMPLSKIKTRIKNNYYRRIEALLADFDQLLFNAELYITKENVYYEYAAQIVKELKSQILNTEKQVQMNFEIEVQKVFEDASPVQEEEKEIQKELEDFEIIIDESLPIKKRSIIWIIHNKSKYCCSKPMFQKKKTEIPEIHQIAQPVRALRSFKSSSIVSQEEIPEMTKSQKQRNYRLRDRAKKCNYAE